MNKFFFTLLLAAGAFFSFTTFKPSSVHNYTVKDILGNDVPLSKYKGKVLLIVNVASRCGYTPQYADLQDLYDQYADKGLVVLGFPANDFGNQEPGTDEEIHTFCTEKFGVTFPMFSKISVKGDDMHPLYEYLTSKTKNKTIEAPIQWNFQKFLVDAKGQVVSSYPSKVKVSEPVVIAAIEEQLAKLKTKTDK